MRRELSEHDKKAMQRAVKRRKENQIRLGRIALMADKSQVEAFNELWESWIARWGKTGAMDNLIKIMAIVEAKMQDRKRIEEAQHS